ncbi:MAG: family peptidase [Candidatus Thermoplasmatota archaeon]|nr:family peptidase [Candidatus Thermoplasmatota archaeon]
MPFARSTSPRTISAFASAILLLTVLSASYPSLVVADSASAQGDSKALAYGGQRSVLSMTSHLATEADIDALKARLGVRQPGETYEPVVVDGFGTGISPRSDTDWQRLVGQMVVYEVEALPAELSSTFDLSGDPEFPTVGDQAAQGSCSAWAATYYSYGYLEAVDNAWTEASQGNSSQLLSPAWTYNMVNGGRDQGSWVDTNMMVVRDWGAATMSAMPYDDDDPTSWGSPEAFREASLHRASEVGYIDYSPSMTVDSIKALVAAGTPVAFAMDANEFTSGFSDGNYVISSTEYSSTSLNHAQTIVGYDDSLSDDGDSGAFRVVNSWGADWGDSGYYWLTYSALEELGELGILYLNFMVDIQGYQPSLIGVWHFDSAPSRVASISIGVGSAPTGEGDKTPFYDGGMFTTSLTFPTFMCLDVTELAPDFWSEGAMHLSIGDAKTDGAVSSFRVEGYDRPFLPGRAAQLSEQSQDVPADTPATVAAFSDYYESIAVEDALECDAMVWSSYGQAAWVGVDHHYSSDGDSMQSGDVSDGGSTRLDAQLEGPAEVSFEWMVSSEAGDDVLSFYVNDAVRDSISGLTGWESVSVVLEEGPNRLSWIYSKDGSFSSYDDAGWLDSVVVAGYVTSNQVPALVSLATSLETNIVQPGGTVTFHVQVEDLEGGTLTVESSYGDGTAGDTLDLVSVPGQETVSFWFNHTYVVGSDTAYAATFTAMDGDEHELTEWDEATTDILVNTPPTASISTESAMAATGQLVAFDASGSSDPETDPASLQCRWDWTSDGVWDTEWSVASEATHTFNLPGEYEVTVEVMDGAGLLSSASTTVTVTGEAIPEFSVVVVPVFSVLLAMLVAMRARRRKVM